MERAAEIETFCTATGDKNVIGRDALERLKDGAILSNTAFQRRDRHPGPARAAVAERESRPNVEEFELADGRRVYLIGEGRLVNLAAAEGTPRP